MAQLPTAKKVADDYRAKKGLTAMARQVAALEILEKAMWSLEQSHGVFGTGIRAKETPDKRYGFEANQIRYAGFRILDRQGKGKRKPWMTSAVRLQNNPTFKQNVLKRYLPPNIQQIAATNGQKEISQQDNSEHAIKSDSRCIMDGRVSFRNGLAHVEIDGVPWQAFKYRFDRKNLLLYQSGSWSTLVWKKNRWRAPGDAMCLSK